MLLFKADKLAFSQAVAPVAGILEPKAEEGDPARYLNVRCLGGKLLVYAVRQDMAALAEIEDPSLFEYPPSSEGKGLALDPCFCVLLDKLKVMGSFTVELPAPSGPDPDGKGPLKALGAATCTMPSLTKKNEPWDIPSWEPAPVPSFGDGPKATLEAGEFAKLVRQVEFAVGDDGGDIKYRNMLLKVSGTDLHTTTISTGKLALAKGTHKGSTGDFVASVRYVNAAAMAKALPDREGDAEILCCGGAGGGMLVVAQPILRAGKRIILLRSRCARFQDPFNKFEKTIGSLSFKHEIRFRRDQALDLLDRIAVLKEDARLTVGIDPVEKTLGLLKRERRGTKLVGAIPLSACQAETFEVEMSDKILKACLDASEAEEVEIKFSGLQSLSRILLGEGDSLVGYIQPFVTPK